MYIKLPINNELLDSIRISAAMQPNKLSTEPVCDFCGDPHPIFVYRANKTSLDIVKGWAVCADCSAALDTSDWNHIKTKMKQVILDKIGEYVGPNLLLKGYTNIATVVSLQVEAAVLHYQETLILSDTTPHKIEMNTGSGKFRSEESKQAQNTLTAKNFRAAPGGGFRMDAIFYCLAALERFETMTPIEVRNVGFEIAILGIKGLNITDPDSRYHLDSLNDDFSGLQALCYEYVAFKQIDPKQNIGFDLHVEYETALSMKCKGF